VTAANSLTGSNPFDRVGNGGSVALPNGNYVVRSYFWNGNRGAATFADGTTGITGVVSSANSLTGTSEGDSIGDLSVMTLPNGNYLVVSRAWNQARGAVTWGSRETGVSGEITPANSLVGGSPDDQVGYTGNVENGVIVFNDGSYAVRSNYWDNIAVPAADAGAVSFSKRNQSVTGMVTAENSVLGTASLGGFRLAVGTEPYAKQLVVGHPNNRVSIFRYNENRTPFDFDGDGRSDISVFRPADGTWYLNRSQSGFTAAQFGISTDKLAPADYDGDGKADLGVFRAGVWYLLKSTEGFTAVQFGAGGDVPAPGDYDGDGKADIAVFRPSDGTWYLLRSRDGFTATQFGASGDKTAQADYDGDGKTDLAVFRGGVWYLLQSSQGFNAVQFGVAGDRIVPGDYDGDGKCDFAVYRDGVWYLLRSSAGFTGFQFGIAADTPAPADFDGDGKFDAAVFRNGDWYYLRSSDNAFIGLHFGAVNDKPVSAAFAQ
jgi:hypothetical protein